MAGLPVSPGIPDAARGIFAPFLDIARNVGVGVSGTRGVGKTGVLRTFALLDFFHHRVPTVVIDPVGKLSQGLLTQFACYEPEAQRAFSPRLRYVDWSHPDLVLPTPAYERSGFGSEAFFDVAQRLPDVFIKMDPPLTSAGKQGANPLWQLATRGGELLQAMGCQATELEHVVRYPRAWEERIGRAAREHPEVRPAAEYVLSDYARLRPSDRDAVNGTLLTKLTLLSAPPMRARFGAHEPGIPKRQLVAEQLLVIHDLSAPQPWQVRQFKMLWLLLDLFDFAKRGGSSREQPLSIIIDEAAALLSPGPNQSALLAGDLSEFVNQWSRNTNTWLTLAYQEPYQLYSPSREAIMSLGTHFYGRMTDPPSARAVAERNYDFDPEDVHQTHAVYGGRAEVIDYRDEIFSWPEQLEKHRSVLRRLPAHAFLLAAVRDEGAPPEEPRLVDLSRFNRGIHPQDGLWREGARRLLERHGVPVADLVAEIDGRLPPAEGGVPARREAEPAPEDALPDALPEPPAGIRRRRVGN